MIPVPDVKAVDVAFGNIDHLPKWEEIPDKFKCMFEQIREPHCKLFSRWFYEGITIADFGTPREGVNADKAVAALGAIMKSYAPKHEHKEAGVAMLIHEWFIIPGQTA
jgi:hypothetical protein